MRKSRHEIIMQNKIDYLKKTIEVIPCDDEYEERETRMTCCNKVGYNTQQEAISDMKTMTGRTSKPIRAYCCSEGKWHLTKMSIKSEKDNAKKR